MRPEDWREHDSEKCEPCLTVAETFEWGHSLKPDQTHCTDCGWTWSAKTLGHCVVCHRMLGGDYAWDAHLNAPNHDLHAVVDSEGWPVFGLDEKGVWRRNDPRRPFREVVSARLEPFFELVPSKEAW